MSNNVFFDAYIHISIRKFSICVIHLENSKKIYENKSLIRNDLNKIDFQKFQKFLDDNVLKIEKTLKEFIKNIHIIIETEDFSNIQISLKNYNNGRILTSRDLSYSLNEARYQCKKTLENKKIVHMLIDNYRVNDQDYTFLPENLECNNYSLDIKFICLSHNFVKKLENCLEKYQISISKIINAEYVENYFNNDDDLFIKAKKITEGCNPNEIEFLNKIRKKQGFFEKFFNFFK